MAIAMEKSKDTDCLSKVSHKMECRIRKSSNQITKFVRVGHVQYSVQYVLGTGKNEFKFHILSYLHYTDSY